MLSTDLDNDSAPRADRLADGDVPMDRRSYLGGPDASAVLGINPYKTAHEVWLEKTGRAEPVKQNLAMRIGLLAEPMLSTLFEERTGKSLEMVKPLRHSRFPFIGGSPDRNVKGESTTVELKTANIRTADRWGDEGTDEVPEEYIVQVQIYLSLQDHDRGDLAVLLGGSDFRIYHLIRDRELEGEMLERLAKFWRDHVIADKPPAVDGSDGAASMLASLHKHSGPDLAASSPEADAAAERYLAARKAREAWEAKEELAKQQLQTLIGEHKGIKTAAGSVSWPTVRGRVSTDWEAVSSDLGASQELIQKHTTFGASYRRFTLKANKGA